MAWCLIPKLADKFKQAIIKGEINPGKISEMSPKERHKFFADLLGEKDAKQVNALFESKLLLKNKERGWINWAKQLSGMKAETKRDIISKIQRMVNDVKTGKTILNPETEEKFLEDLASSRLGFDVNFEEAKKISELTTKMNKSAKSIGKGETERLQHGYDLVNLKNYVDDLKFTNKEVSWKERINPLNREFAVYQVPGFAKAVKASFDVSALLRQGLKTLLTNPGIWAKNTMKTFGDVVKQIKYGSKSNAVMDAIKADIYSRPNALNGKYNKLKLAVGITEEQFPTSAPSKVLILGRLFKASETAYTGFLYRCRADLADKLIEVAEKQGISMGDKLEAESIGRLINSMTGRGSIGKAEVLGKEINAALFSIKFLKSNWDTLTLHAGSKMSTFARKEAAKNLLKIVAGIGVVLKTADTLQPGSVEWDPRSSDFGKIKIGDTRFDVSGGMASLITLAARQVYTRNEGKWGSYSKSSTTGKISQLSSGEYGSQTRLEAMYDFWEKKTSPMGSVILDMLRGETMMGKPLSLKEEATNLLMPLPVTNFQELKDNPNSAPIILSMLADALGVGTNTYSSGGEKDWSINPGKEMTQFKTKVGDAKFKSANDEYNKTLNDKMKTVIEDPKYKKLTEEGKQKVIAKLKENVKNSIFQKYGFKYKQDRESSPEKSTIDSLSK